MIIYMALYMEINKKYTIKFCRLHSYFLKKSKLNISNNCRKIVCK